MSTTLPYHDGWATIRKPLADDWICSAKKLQKLQKIFAVTLTVNFIRGYKCIKKNYTLMKTSNTGVF